MMSYTAALCVVSYVYVFRVTIPQRKSTDFYVSLQSTFIADLHGQVSASKSLIHIVPLTRGVSLKRVLLSLSVYFSVKIPMKR